MTYQSRSKELDTCTNNYYITIYARTNIFEFSFVPITVKDWNSLPRSAVEIVEDAKIRNYLLSMIL